MYIYPKSHINQNSFIVDSTVWSSSIPLLTYFSDIVLPILLRNRGLDIENVNDVKVLELGSGTGLLGIGIASLGCKVVLTDPSLDMNLSEEHSSNTIEHLRKNVEQNKDLTGDR